MTPGDAGAGAEDRRNEQLGAVVRPASCPHSRPKGPPVTGHRAQQNHHMTQEKPPSSQGVRWQCPPFSPKQGWPPQNWRGCSQRAPRKTSSNRPWGTVQAQPCTKPPAVWLLQPHLQASSFQPSIGGSWGGPRAPHWPPGPSHRAVPSQTPQSIPRLCQSLHLFAPIDTPELPAGLFLQLGRKKGGKRTFKAQKVWNCCRAHAPKQGFS